MQTSSKETREPDIEHRVAFRSFEEWNDWLQIHPDILKPALVHQLVAHVRARGLECEFCDRRLPAEEIVIRGENYRETIVCPCGLNARQRAVLSQLTEFARGQSAKKVRIFAPEALSPFALKLRGKYVRFVGTEFTTDQARRDELFPIPFQDLSALTFPDARFDTVVVNEVFEHVPDLPTVLHEVARVLRPHGALISSFPFAFMEKGSIRRARMEHGRVVHILEPEYHGDPMNQDGVLVYQIPGWDILDTAREAGFTDVEMRLLSSKRFGYAGSGIHALFVLHALKG